MTKKLYIGEDSFQFPVAWNSFPEGHLVSWTLPSSLSFKDSRITISNTSRYVYPFFVGNTVLTASSAHDHKFAGKYSVDVTNRYENRSKVVGIVEIVGM